MKTGFWLGDQVNAKDLWVGNKEHHGQSKDVNSVWTALDMLGQIFPRSGEVVVSMEEK